MAANDKNQNGPRTEGPPPSTETTTRNRTRQRNIRRTGSTHREIRDFSGETKDIEAVLTLVTEQVEKGVTFERFQETLKNYV